MIDEDGKEYSPACGLGVAHENPDQYWACTGSYGAGSAQNPLPPNPCHCSCHPGGPSC